MEKEELEFLISESWSNVNRAIKDRLSAILKAGAIKIAPLAIFLPCYYTVSHIFKDEFDCALARLGLSLAAMAATFGVQYLPIVKKLDEDADIAKDMIAINEGRIKRYYEELDKINR